MHAREAHSVSVTGTGVIDGQSPLFMSKENPEGFLSRPGCPRGFGFFGCRNIRIEGITIRNTPDWAIHPAGCEDVVIHGVTVRNHLKVPNCDGINPDHCRNVRISDCHIESGDDGICIKTRSEWNRFGPCRNITITNCTVISTSCGIKIGTETHQDVSDVVVSNCIVYGSNRGLGIAHRDAGNVENISFSNCIVKTRLFHPRWWGKAEPIYITALPRDKEVRLGSLRNIYFDNIRCDAENGIYIQGFDGCRPSNIRLSNVDLHVHKKSKWESGYYDPRPCLPEVMPYQATQSGKVTPWGSLVKRDIAGFYVEKADEVRIVDARLRWGTSMPSCYRHGVETFDTRSFALERFTGNAAQPELDGVVEQSA
ncbi:glycosyl hydrolase family 28 protein [Okeania sp. SIO1H5]|uniref:glycoside hydrolase family 28 protein n=1 Tax=Okeania sp. SIO1H5 TaxID=2607777 RepID=UPI00338EF67E